jgi:phosphoribosylcarboxyaminoimidazole (NCAIR) mutase
MPGDVPVATVAVGMGGARNAGLLAVQILALSDATLAQRLAEFKQNLVQKISAKNDRLQEMIRNDAD